MIYLNNLFWILVVLFAFIGAFRGAAKEMLVILSILIALFFITLMYSSEYVVNELAKMGEGKILFFVQLGIIILLVVFGYQTPFRARLPIKEHISANRTVEHLLGAALGALNGYLIFGTIWHYMHIANYPISFVLSPEAVGGDMYVKVMDMMALFPAYWLKPTTIYFVIGIAITVIIVLYV